MLTSSLFTSRLCFAYMYGYFTGESEESARIWKIDGGSAIKKSAFYSKNRN